MMGAESSLQCSQCIIGEEFHEAIHVAVVNAIVSRLND